MINLPNGKPSSLVCEQAVTVDMELHILLGSALTQSGVCWQVTDQLVGDPLLGFPLLESFDLNTRDILAAAADSHLEVVDVVSIRSTRGKVSWILEGVFHADGGADSSELTERMVGSTWDSEILSKRKIPSTKSCTKRARMA